MSLVTESTALKPLEYLSLSRCAFDKESLDRVFVTPNLCNLEVLGLSSLKLSLPKGVNQYAFPLITKDDCLNRLKAIDLRFNRPIRVQGDWTNAVMVFQWKLDKAYDFKVHETFFG